MKKFICLTLFSIIISGLYGVNEISLKGGAMLTSDRDLVWSPVLNNSLTPIGELSWLFGGERTKHDLNLFFSMGDITSSISDISFYNFDKENNLRGDRLIMSDMDYTYWFYNLGIDNLNVYLGVGLEFDFQMILGNFPVFTAGTSLNIGMNFIKNWGNHQFGGTFLIPVVTYLNRAPFTGTNDLIMERASNDMFKLLTDGYITSFNDYINIDLNFSYKYKITNKLKLDTGVSLGYTYMDTPREKWMLESTLLIGIGYDFKGEK